MAPWRRSGATLCCLLRFGIPAPQHAVAGWRDWGSRPFGARCGKRHLPLVTPRPVFASDAYFFWTPPPVAHNRLRFADELRGSPGMDRQTARWDTFPARSAAIGLFDTDYPCLFGPSSGSFCACFHVGVCVFWPSSLGRVVFSNGYSWRAFPASGHRPRRHARPLVKKKEKRKRKNFGKS